MMASYQQDWDPVVLRKTTTKKPTTERELAEAKNKGQIETLRKHDAGVNRQRLSSGTNLKKLDDTDLADFKHQTITHEFKVELQKARQSKGWTQKELAQKINQKSGVIAEYESGSAIPNPQIISILNRTLGVLLPKIPKKKIATNDE